MIMMILSKTVRPKHLQSKYTDVVEAYQIGSFDNEEGIHAEA